MTIPNTRSLDPGSCSIGGDDAVLDVKEYQMINTRNINNLIAGITIITNNNNNNSTNNNDNNYNSTSNNNSKSNNHNNINNRKDHITESQR